MPVATIRHLRKVTPPLAGYLRVGHRDAGLMSRLLEQGLPAPAGVIVDPTARSRTDDLRSAARENGVEVVLDSRSVELSTLGGLRNSALRLPWAPTSPHTVRSLAGASGDEYVEAVAAAAVDQGATGVLSPSHFLDMDSDWLHRDVELASKLRRHLDKAGGQTITLYYPIVASLRTLRHEPLLKRILTDLSQLRRDREIDGLFLRIHAFGTSQAGPRNLRNYLTLARHLHSLRVPIVAERSGSVGVALAAFGAVGGVESSITYGDSYDARRYLKPSVGRGFVPPPRVYIAGAMTMVTLDEARAIFSRRGFSRLACQEMCCGRGRESTLADARRHFVVSRTVELSRLSAIPEPDRAEAYLTTMLMPARDSAAQLARTFPALSRHRNRLDDWYLALRHTHADDHLDSVTTALAPTGRRLATSA